MAKRNLSVDVLRGMGILTVVAGHANSGTGLHAFGMYSFHMPLFFFLSGLFFSEGRLEGPVSAILNNARSLLLPSTIFYFVYAVFSQILGLAGFAGLWQPFSLGQILFNQFLGSGFYPFTAAYWFIPCLFFVRVYFAIVHTRLSFAVVTLMPKHEALRHVAFAVFYLLIGFAAVSVSRRMYQAGPVNWDGVPFLRVAFALFFYYAGFLCSRYNGRRFLVSVPILFTLYVVEQQLWATGWTLDFWMQASKYEDTFLPVVTSIIGTAFFYGLAGIAAKTASCRLVFGYLGRNSLPILLHHLLGFFVVNLVLCMAGVIKVSDVTGQFYQWDTVHTWPVYILSGVAVSLAK